MMFRHQQHSFQKPAFQQQSFQRQDFQQQGFSLIEMIMAIVVLASASAILFSVSTNIAKSADPMILQQAIIIAEGYLEEATLKSYSDPDGGETGSCEEGAGNRNLFDDVADYDCINDTSGALDQFGGTLAGLDAYNVVINVSNVSIGSPSVNARRVDVTVTHDTYNAINTIITAYRAPYY